MHNHQAGATPFSYYGATRQSSDWRHVQVCASEIWEQVNEGEEGVCLLKEKPGSEEERTTTQTSFYEDKTNVNL